MNKKLIQSLLFTLAITVGTPVFAQAPPPSTWVQHVIVVIQENRTPDNLFQDTTLYNKLADILPAGSANAPCNGLGFPPMLALTPAPLDACFNPNHGHGPATGANAGGFEGAYDSGNGTFDKACKVQAQHANCGGHPAIDADNYSFVEDPPNPSGSYESGHLLDPYFQIAEGYSWANYAFQTNQGPSFNAHQFLFSGTSAPAEYGGSGSGPWTLFAVENATNLGLDYHFAGCVSDPNTVVNDLDSASQNNNPWPPEGGTINYTPPYLYMNNALPGYPCYTHPSLADLLDKPPTPLQPITWKYYIQSPQDDNSIWTAPNALSAICPFAPSNNSSGVCNSGGGGNGDWANVVDAPGQVLNDIANCNMPAVSWVIPDGSWSDHPGDVGSDGGPSWVEAIVNAVGATKNCGGYQQGLAGFNNTVIIITWDDWGGFFDHIAPYLSGGGNYPGGYVNPPASAPDDGKWYTYGFRVPLLIVSPYTSAGYISGPTDTNHHTVNENPPYVHDFGSILGFIEAAFNLPPYDSNGNGGNKCGIEFTADPGCNYPYADYFAPDGAFECANGACGPNWGGYPLADFFNLATPRTTFVPITGAKYGPTCFTNPTQVGCFPDSYPQEPDDD